MHSPIALDPPAPVGGDAVQVTTVHQAKGLEYPVVVLWDGRGKWDTREDAGPWSVERGGAGWVLNLHGLEWEHPQGSDLRARDKRYRDAERKRVIYVAATRARDLLVLSCAGDLAERHVCRDLLEDAPAGTVRTLPTYDRGSGSEWSREVQAPPPMALSFDSETETTLEIDWNRALARVEIPILSPVAISSQEVDGEEARPRRPGRFGATFGIVVHRAIGIVLARPELSAAEAVRRAARAHGFDPELGGKAGEAAADVERALAALASLGLRRPPGADLRIEYPVAGVDAAGSLLTGYVDLVGVVEGTLTVIDFKTDAIAESQGISSFPEYAAQVRTYARLLGQGNVGESGVRCGLLFTMDGGVRWC